MCIRDSIYTIEFKKRGLPYMHLLKIKSSRMYYLRMHPEDKIHSSEEFDDFISAEIPDDNDQDL